MTNTLDIPSSEAGAFLHNAYRRRPDGAASNEASVVTDSALHVVRCPCCPLTLSACIQEGAYILDEKLIPTLRVAPDPLRTGAADALAAGVEQPISFRLQTRTENVWVFGSVQRLQFGPMTLLHFSFVHPGERNLPRKDALIEWFGLSRTEAELAIELANGADVASIAERRHLSTLTVRTHLRTIFDKTNTHKQQDLVALLVRLAALC